jgi:UDP-N-acetylglucosamine 2-epimerase (non-hydrolysing)
VKKKYDVALLVGTRPNFVKAGPLLRLLEDKNISTLFIHTGQHFDEKLSKDIFDDLNIRVPDINLETPALNSEEQLRFIIKKLLYIFNENEINRVGVFGDVTSTLAGALAAKKSNILLFHVEAGLRSFNLNMPEERNRIIVDSISNLLFTPSEDAVENLLAEGVNKDKIFNVGNIMIDTLTNNFKKIENNVEIIKEKLHLQKPYFVLTLHRPSNMSDNILNSIFSATKEFSNQYDVILPAHPRLKIFLEETKINYQNIKLIDPLAYIDFLSLVKGSQLVLTDSGGLQEETTYLGVKCLTLREETERPITVSEGTNKVIGTSQKVIISEINNSLGTSISNKVKINYWDGNTSNRIFEVLFKEL